MRILLNILIAGISLFYSPLTMADGGHDHEGERNVIDTIMHIDLLEVAIWSFLLLLGIISIAILVKPKTEAAKKGFFWTIVVISLGITVLFIAQTTIKNVLSESKGPVHWHADFRLYDCGEELDLLDPTGFLNRIGTPEIHEHNDKRIHIEGTMMKISDASLGSFFEKIGGELSKDTFTVPLNDGIRTMKNGERCEGSKKSGEVQVFLWSMNEAQDVASQSKLDDYPGYVMFGHSAVPPGDCVIIEFGERKAYTEHLCEQYEVAERNGKIKVDYSHVR